MRIAYVAHLNDGTASGVVAKVAAQTREWRTQHHIARVFVWTADEDRAWAKEFGDARLFAYRRAPSRFAATSRLVRAVRAFRPDVVYLRYDLFYPSMAFLPRGVPVVIEVNTDDREEYRLERRLRAVYNRLTRDLLLRRAAAIVFVTTELRDARSFRGYPGRRVVITNGIALDDYPCLPARATGPPRLAFVGTPAPWHGLDKLVRLAELRPSWRFDVVGIDDPGAGPDAITWHGPLERPDVLEVLRDADAGVGTLALHRKSLDEASPLKVREYLAVGLPVLYGYRDPDADELEGVLRIANTETNVVDALERIDAFVSACRGRRVPRHAVMHLDVAAKEAQRLELFASVARS